MFLDFVCVCGKIHSNNVSSKKDTNIFAAMHNFASLGFQQQRQEEFRSVHVNKPEQNALYRYCGNVTTTSKYSTVSFLPKNLFEQFRRIANVYFLVISILQLSTNLSPTNKYATIGPLCCVLFVNMVKEGFEDYARHQSDEKVNQRKSIQLLNGKDQSLLWQDVSVGAICKVIEGQECPADMVLLVSSHTQGHCYVETANLDGETNLKVLYSLKETQEIKSLDGLNKLQGAVKCEHPNSRLYSFTGTLYPTQGSEVSIDISNVILRGTVLRNTPFVYGLVIFTGADTKIIQNSREVPSKRSYLEKQINHTILHIFFGLALLCIYFTISYVQWVFEKDSEVWYLDYLRDENGADSASSFITFLILYNNLTPISLYVSMEFVRLYQAKFIDNDLKMYHETSDTPAKARTSNLNEELGQIQYVLSDKTGTLTCNEMKFSKMTCEDQMFYLQSSLPKSELAHRRDEFTLETITPERNSFLYNSLLVMGICHTAIPSLKENADSGSTSAQIEYQSPSPDEVALLNAARLAQFVLEERSQSQVVLNIRGERRVYEILNINEFNSVRKRMSIIVKTPEDKIMLFCKGADSVMMELLRPGQAFIQNTRKSVDRFANEGLRTLVLAMAELSEEEYHIWHMKFKDASTSLTDRQSLLDEAAAMIESNLTLLGATGVEDRLQDLVPDTIQTLMRAGIRVWMLTGDKQETAMNIAYSAKLFHHEMHVVKVNTHDEGKLMSLIDGGIKKFQEQFEKNNTLFGLVVDGATLHLVMKRPDIKHRFCKLMKICTSVVACRVSPAQKAEIVQLVRSSESPEPFTLAIGDGGNDVNMIQEAHIGVGISGKEGMQAVQSSDFAIAQFRFLKDLLLIHGKWNYYRMCKFVLYSFYKNVAFVIVLVLFTTDNGYSGTTLFESWLGAGWNVAWTFLPIIVFAITDKDCSAKIMETFPHLYMYGPLSLGYSVSKFGKWVFAAIIHAAIIYYLCKGAYQGVLSSEGYSDGLFFFGTIVNGALMLVVNLKILIEAHSLNKIFVGSVVLSVISWFLFVGVYSFLYAISPDFYHVGTELFSRSIFWVGLPLVPTACILVDYIGKIVKNTYRPTPFDVANEIEYLMQRQPKMQEKTLNEGKMQPVMMVAQSPRVAFVSEAEDPSASNQTPHQLTTASVFESSPNIEVEEPSVIYHDIPMNKYTLEFSDYPRLEHRLQGHHFLRVRHLSRVIWVMVYFYTVIVYIFTYLRGSDMRSGFSAQVTLITIYGMYTLFLFSSLRKKYFQELIMVCFVMFRIVGEFSSSTSERMLYQTITPPIGFLLSGMRFKQSFVVVAISVIYYIATLVSTSWSSQSSYSALGTLISFAVSAAGAYKHEKSMRRDFLLRQELRIEKSVTRSILENMIPPFIANKIKDGYTSIANAEPSVSVLFCEIMDFEDIVSDTSPEEFIRMLDKIFNHFDGLCEFYDVQKIETVGPVYMACAGLQNSGVNHALSVAKLAENMLADSPKFIRQNGLPVRIRIGINTGPVVSGVVGKKKPQYCLFGDTVNTASRMESTAPPLSVQVTHTTFKSIQSNYGAIERTIHAKGKGEMKVYILITDETSSLTLHSNDRKNSKKAPVYDAGLVSIQDLREYLEDDVSTTTQDINYYNLRFLSRRVEAEYEAETEEENQWQFRANMLLFVTIAIIITTADERKAFETVSGQVASALMIALVAICTLFAVYRSSAWFLRHKQYYVTFAYLYFGVMGSAYFMIRGNEDVGVWPSAVSSIWSILVAVFGGLRLPETVFLCAVVIFISLGSVVSDDSFHDKEWLRKNKMNISSEGVLVTYLIFNLLIVILFKYYKDYYGRRAFLMRSSIYQETKTSNQLLNSMVPDGVLRQLRIGTGVVAQVYRNVAILYSDIVGFTSTSSKSDPHEIVQMLSLLFSTLDVQSAIHEVYKVQTIGDAYVAVAGIPIHDEDEQDPIHPCMKMMKFANGMIRAVSTMTTPGGSPLRVRIGVHYGSIVGGVIGRKSLRFDIWGKDAIIAARLESQGLPGMVHMSSEFMHQVQKDYTISCCRYSKFGGEERTKTFFYDPSIDISGNPNPKNS